MTLRPYLLGLVALGLAILVAWDYWPAPAPVSKPEPLAPVAKVALLNPMSQRAPAEFAPLFDRPLFDPARSKPVTEPEPATVAAEVPAPEVPTTNAPPQPVLMGTVTSPWPGGAFLGDDAGGPVTFLRPGQAALGLSLEAVQPDSAVFMGPSGEVTLHLQPAPSAPGADAPALPAIPSP